MTLRKAKLATFATSLAIQGCGVITGVLTARILGPRARGELATVLLWPTVLSNLGLMGCSWAVARAVAVEPQREDEWARAAAIVGFGLALMVSLIGYFLVGELLPTDKQYLVALTRICLLLIPLDIFNQILLATEQGRMRWLRYNVLRASFFVLYAILVFVVWVTGRAEVQWFIRVFLTSHLVTVLIRLAVHRRALFAARSRIRDCWNLLRKGMPYFWSTASNLFSLQVDKMLVVGLMRADAVGLYAAAVTFSNAHASLGDALGITSFAVMANETNLETQGRILSQTFRRSTLIAVGLGAALAVLIPFVVRPLFGREFVPAVRPAIILTLATSIAASTNILNQGLKGAGKPFPGMLSQMLGTCVLALGAWIFCPSLGLIGIALASVMSSFCQVCVLVVASAALLRISPFAFWAFSVKDVHLLFQSIFTLRLKYS